MSKPTKGNLVDAYDCLKAGSKEGKRNQTRAEGTMSERRRVSVAELIPGKRYQYRKKPQYSYDQSWVFSHTEHVEGHIRVYDTNGEYVPYLPGGSSTGNDTAWDLFTHPDEDYE